mmetsp:Transcript_24019/g.18329  ORF Transcript_24019/g.18329 Transcript_24019/m.18329 type:complete len:109 (-) Transcript_24019:875-1201(-)
MDVYHLRSEELHIICGLELVYVLDGNNTQYVSHYHSINTLQQTLANIKLKPLHPLSNLFLKKAATIKESSEMRVEKCSFYFQNNEYIIKFKVAGEQVIQYMQFETNLG